MPIFCRFPSKFLLIFKKLQSLHLRENCVCDCACVSWMRLPKWVNMRANTASHLFWIQTVLVLSVAFLIDSIYTFTSDRTLPSIFFSFFFFGISLFLNFFHLQSYPELCILYFTHFQYFSSSNHINGFILLGGNGRYWFSERLSVSNSMLLCQCIAMIQI